MLKVRVLWKRPVVHDTAPRLNQQRPRMLSIEFVYGEEFSSLTVRDVGHDVVEVQRQSSEAWNPREPFQTWHRR